MNIGPKTRTYTIEPVRTPVPVARDEEQKETEPRRRPHDKRVQPTSNASQRDVAPDYVEPVVAWRAREVRSGAGGPALEPLRRTTLTPDVSTTARCMAWRAVAVAAQPPRAPRECDCGIYATTLAVPTPDPRTLASPGISASCSAASAWGRVAECVNGWRAEAHTRAVVRAAVRVAHGGARRERRGGSRRLPRPSSFSTAGPESTAGELVRPLVVRPAA
jgi:hypothetical protein